NHDFSRTDIPIIQQPSVSRGGITVEPNVWLGGRVTVLDGVTIGRGSGGGAGSPAGPRPPPSWGGAAVGAGGGGGARPRVAPRQPAVLGGGRRPCPSHPEPPRRRLALGVH